MYRKNGMGGRYRYRNSGKVVGIRNRVTLFGVYNVFYIVFYRLILLALKFTYATPVCRVFVETKFLPMSTVTSRKKKQNRKALSLVKYKMSMNLLNALL